MSETTTDATTTETPEGEPAPETAPRPNKEARYRVERNEARDERDALAQRVERLNRAEVERLASDALSHPGDLFSLSGNELTDYLTDEGEVDAEKVAADVAAVLAERPGLRKGSPAFDPTQGFGGAPQAKREPTMADLLSQRN